MGIAAKPTPTATASADAKIPSAPVGHGVGRDPERLEEAPQPVLQVQGHCRNAREVYGGDQVGLGRIASGSSVPNIEAERRVDMYGERQDQTDAKYPQDVAVRYETSAKVAERFAVLVGFFGAQEDLQCAEEMGDDESQDRDATQRHNPFATNGALVDAQAAAH